MSKSDAEPMTGGSNPEEEKCFHQALSDFEVGRYRESFFQFVELYSDGYEREGIFDILTQAFYDPNVEELQDRYEKNRKALAQYPYIWCEPPDFDALPVCLYPLSDTEYYEFDVKTREFKSLYSPMKEDERPYFFQQLDRPLFIESERNFYNLKYLNDTVRRSEDFAGDNHIYLFYRSMNALLALMLACDLTPLLDLQKFVFLIGEPQRCRYPIDFLTEFSTDYAAMAPQRLRIEEMNRLCFWYKRGFAGMTFAFEVLNQNPYIIAQDGTSMHEFSYIKGCPVAWSGIVAQLLQNLEKRYVPQQIREIYHHPDIQLNWPQCLDFVTWLEEGNARQTDFTLSELFRAYFIYCYEKEKPEENPRVAPVILWEPHYDRKHEYDPLTLTFPYHFVLNSMRNPTAQMASQYKFGKFIFPLNTEYLLAAEMHPDLRRHYYAYCFEDLKLYPEEMCRRLCELFDVPYTEKMLGADSAYQTEYGETLTCFDTRPLYRSVDAVFSQFDQVRIQIYYDMILRHYGYPTFNFEECPMTDSDIAWLMKFPFRFERDYIRSVNAGETRDIYGGGKDMTAQQLRERLYQNMMYCWQLGQKGSVVLPKVIKPASVEDNEVRPDEQP